MKFLLTIALIGLFAVLTVRALDVEHARAGMEDRGGIGVALVAEDVTYQGKGVRWWARRAVQARKDANARGLTIRRLRGQLGRGFIPWYWVAVGSCESGLRWDYNGSSGFDGAVQFHPGTWSANRLYGYPPFAYQASPFQQLVVAEIVLAHSGWGQWPACSRKLGLR